MRLLFIKPKHIGDSLILTPTLVAAKQAHPQAEIWVVVRRGCEGILAGCPVIDKIITLAAVDKRERHWSDPLKEIGVWLKLSASRFDYVFELGDGHRGRRLAFLARGGKRYSVNPASPLKPRELKKFDGVSSFDWHLGHRVEKDYRSVAEFFPLPQEIPPLNFVRERTRPWEPARELKSFALMQIGSRQGFNLWPREKWLAAGNYLRKRFGHLVISCGKAPHELEEATRLQKQMGSGVLTTLGQAGWPEMADLLYRAQLCLTPNTATMHLAAACQCPTVAIFGPTFEDNWRPWKSPNRIVAQRDDVVATDPAQRMERMRTRTAEAVELADVLAACEELKPRSAP